MLRFKAALLGAMSFALAFALPVLAGTPVITLVSPVATSTAELTQHFQVSSDKPLASATVEMGLINGGFEDGNLDLWTTGGDAPWAVSTNTLPWGNAAKEGGYFAHSPLAGTLTGTGVSSWIERSVQVSQTSTLEFWAKAYLRYGNHVAFSLDGADLAIYRNASISSWTKMSFAIPPGVHTLRFTYYRNINQNASYEAFLLDQVRWLDVPLPQQLSVNNSEEGSSASGDAQFVEGIIDYRIRAIDTEDNVGYSAISQMKAFTPPTIYFYGDNPLTANIDAMGGYKDAGAYAYDAVDGDVSASLASGGLEGSGNLGPNYYSYSAKNSFGLASTAKRTINVVDLTPPVISINGDMTTSTEKFGSYADLGASATDNCTGPQSIVITTSSDFDINAEGTYYYVYSAADEFGNVGHATRTINVIDTLPPRIYGVENGAYYNSPVTLQFDEGTATLNGEAFASGTKVDISGSYTLVVTDAHGLISTVSFNVVLPTTSAGGGSTASASSSGGGGGGSSSASSVAIVYSTPPEPVVLPQPKPQILGVKYGTSTQLAVAKIKLKANGTLIKDSQLRVYVIVGGQKKIISSLAELKKYKNKKIFSVVDAEAALYPDWRPYAVGVLLKTKAGETYLTLKDGTKLLINSTTTLKLMAKVRSYKNVSAVNLAYYPMATFDLSELSKKTDWRPYSVGVILKAADGTMYLTKKGGILHKITNAEELKKYKRYKTIQNVSAEALAFYSAE